MNGKTQLPICEGAIQDYANHMMRQGHGTMAQLLVTAAAREIESALAAKQETAAEDIKWPDEDDLTP